jgi:hypothetical protein
MPLSDLWTKMSSFDTRTIEKLRDALACTRYSNCAGSTHDFYHYPARFSPQVARAVILNLSQPNDWVLDPFCGGGTSIVEGLALGRRMLGVDVNALACFVTEVRTKPLSPADEEVLRNWAILVSEELAASDVGWVPRYSVENLPGPVGTFVAGALELSDGLLPRQLAFVRCALLRLGQWALDCRDYTAPRRKRLAKQFPLIVEDMLEGLREFTAACADSGVPKKEITGRRLILHRSAVGLESHQALPDTKPTLVLTSPPYPGVHVLYHRWQYRGRKETPAPYWIASVPDGHGASFYCGGSRTPTGLQNYFQMITAAFRSVRAVVAPNATIVQLVGFSDVATQLPLYRQAMKAAGLEEVGCGAETELLSRRVPNRKWYARFSTESQASMELLLLHRPTHFASE